MYGSLGSGDWPPNGIHQLSCYWWDHSWHCDQHTVTHRKTDTQNTTTCVGTVLQHWRCGLNKKYCNLECEFRSDAKRKVHRIENSFLVDDVFNLLQFHYLLTQAGKLATWFKERQPSSHVVSYQKKFSTRYIYTKLCKIMEHNIHVYGWQATYFMHKFLSTSIHNIRCRKQGFFWITKMLHTHVHRWIISVLENKIVV